MDHAQIPRELKAEPQWVCWRTTDRDGEATKVPIEPTTGDYASVTAADTWTDFGTAHEYYAQTDFVAGLGFVFDADGPYAGVDLDDCRDPATGAIDDWAADIVHQLDSYTEYSPSGTGLHVIVEGTVPPGGNRRANVEMYDHYRYFTVTGNRVPDAPSTVEQRADELRAIHHDYIAPTESKAEVEPPTQPLSVSDDELLAKAMAAANGDKFEALWNGQTAGYESPSEADQALCTLLAFWTGGDPQRIERLFGQSGLVRDKWRERPDYRERTIRNAIRHCDAFYEPDDA